MSAAASAQDTSAQETSAPEESASASGVENNTSLGEIVVTARKRRESIDTVPLAITAMTSDKIENRNLKSLEDVAAFSPGFYYQAQTGTGTGRNDRSFRQLTFRGIGANSANVAIFAGGIAFLDGAPVLNSSLSNVQDLERVEVLRGPQSVYFGRSTFIGAVNYITKDPTDDFTGRVTAEYAEDNQIDASAAISGPLISDLVNFRISGRFFKRDGQYRTANENVRVGDQQTTSVSASLLIRPADNLRIRAFYNHFEDSDGPPAQYTIGGRRPGLGASNCNLGGAIPGGYYCGRVPQKADRALITANLQLTPALTAALLQNSTNKPIPFDYSDYLDGYGLSRHADQFSNRIDYTFGGTGPTLTSVSAHHEERIVTLADLAFLAVPSTLAASVGYKDYDWSQELRLVSAPGGRFRWTIGGNYIFLKNSTSGIIGQYGPFGVLNFGNAQVGYTQASTPAAFAGLYFDVVPQLTLTLEGRYQADKISGHFGVTATTFADVSRTDKSFSPRVSLDYKLTPTSTVYALASRGYKPGGFNNGILTQPAFVQAQFASTGAAASYDQERLDNFEVGVKGSFFDNRLRFALDGYIGKYRDAQIPIPVVFYTMQINGVTNTNGPINTAILTRNVGSVNLKGVEFEAEAIVSPGLRVGGTLAYTDSKIKSYFCNECGNILAQNATNNIQVTSALGNRLNGTPKIAYTVSASYETTVTDDVTAYVGGDYIYRGSYFAEASNIASSGASEIFNARIGIRKGAYNLELFARNLFDNESPGISYQPSDSSSPTFAYTTGNVLRIALPDRRRIGIRGSVTF